MLGQTGVDRRVSSIAQWLSVFISPDQTTSLQSFSSKNYCELFQGDELDRMANKAVELEDSGYPLIYFSPNPIIKSTPGWPADADILFRKWLLIDIDPVRFGPDGKRLADQKIQSTKSEREAAWKVQDAIHGTMNSIGFINPVQGDSGNGFQLSYMIKWTNDLAYKTKVQTILQHLQKNCTLDDSAKIGTECFDAKRIWKLYGTMSKKGIESENRPYRRTWLLGNFKPWNEEDALSNNVAAERFLAHIANLESMRLGKGMNDRQRLVYRAKKYVAKEPIAIQGKNGSAVCFHVSCILTWRFALTREEAFEAIQEWNFRCQPSWSDKELWHKIDSSIEHTDHQYPKGDLAGVSSNISVDTKTTQTPKDESAASIIPEGESIIVRASEITPRKVEWLWPNRIPLGKLTTFAGVGGLGKTFCLLDITARVSRAIHWPDGSAALSNPGQVLFISGEDDPEDTLVPRLIELGADLSKVAFLKTEVQDRFSLADLPTLDRALNNIGDKVLLIAIDPPTAYLGDVDDHKNSELRRLLAPLKSWSQKNMTSVIFNTHVNKQSNKVDAMMRVMGSVAWVNAVRAAHMFVKDPEDDTKRLFLPLKTNLGEECKGISYRITRTENLARIDWGEEVDTTANEAMNHQVKNPRRVEASEWLISKFREKKEWQGEDLMEIARQEGISKSALFESKKLLNMPKARRNVAADGSVTYIWWVPDDWSAFNVSSDDPPF